MSGRGPFLRSDDVYLRRLERSDLDRCHEWLNRPDIYITMGVFGPRTADVQDQWFDRLLGSRTNLVFALCLATDDVHIGNLSLFDVDYVNSNAGLTIFIADAAHRRRGYGAAAVWLICDYAFRYLNLHKVYCRTDQSLAARLYEKLGFQREGVLRQQAFQHGRYVDKMIFGVLRDELRTPPSLEDRTDQSPLPGG